MENNAVADEARGYKKRHRGKVAVLKKIKGFSVNVRLVDLFFFPADEVEELKSMLNELETFVDTYIAKEELQVEKYKEIIAIEVKAPLNNIEKMVREHTI